MYILTFRHLVQEDSRIPKINPLEIQSWLKFVYTYLPKVNYELDLESIMSSLRLDFEKEGISIRIDRDSWILK